MSKAEKDALKKRIEDLMSQGIEKELATVMAKVEIDLELIKPVVNY